MADLATQIRSYLDETATPLEFDEIFTERIGPEPVQPTRSREPVRRFRPPRLRRYIPGWTQAAAAAVVVLLVLGGLVWLTRSDQQVEPAEEPTVTTLADSSPDEQTVVTLVDPKPEEPPAPPEVPEGFAPAISTEGIDGSWREQYQSIVFGDNTLVVWKVGWGTDWRNVGESLVDEATQLRMESRDNFPELEWMPEEGLLHFHWEGEDPSIVKLRLEFSGTSDDWVIEIADDANGLSIGSVAGSLPLVAEDEILARLANWSGELTWFFVSNGEEAVRTTPPFASFVGFGEGEHFLVAEERIIAFIVTDPLGPGQMTIWRSADGLDWEDMGPTPWSGRTHLLDTLIEVSGEVLALVVGSDEGDGLGLWGPGEGVGITQYWSSSDGAVWVKLTKEEWDQKSGGIEPSSDRVFDNPEQDASVLEYFDEVTLNATVISDDPLVIQPLQGPEPQFDTSVLGLEIPFLPAEPGDEVVALDERLGIDWNDPDGHIPEEPFLYIGRIDGAEFLVFRQATGGLCEMLIDQGGGCGWPRELGSDNPIQFDNDLPGFVHAFVPLEAAAVRLVIDDGEPMWQRPIGRWALFPGRLTATTSYTLEMFDAAGAIIDVDSHTGPPAPSGTTSELLEEALQRETVRNWYGGEDTKDELQYIAAYLANETPWPEPIFDTTGLGVEHPLTAIDPAALTRLPSYADNNFEPVVKSPFLAAAQLQGTSHAAAFHIEIGFADDSVTPNWSLVYSPDSDFDAPLAFAQFDFFLDAEVPNIILMHGGMDPDGSPVVIGGLPPDASVVATTFADGTTVWQRPVSGIAILLDPNMRCVETTDDWQCEGEYLVLDASGSEILRIALTGSNNFEPFHFSVLSP